MYNALDNAIKWNLISPNVTTQVSTPHLERYETKALSIEQAHKLLEAAKGSRIETLLILAITTGARRGELLGLRWDDIDMEHKVLSIRRTLNHISGYRFVENDPKTKSSRRKIMLPNVAIDALKKHRLS